MQDDELQEPLDIPEETAVEPAAFRTVRLDPSSPSIRSIVRVVVIALIGVAISGWVQSIVSSLSYLFFLIVLSLFFAYLIDPIVKLIRRPFKAHGVERFMPRSVAILLAYILVFGGIGFAISNLAPRVVEQAKEFGQNLPSYGATLRQKLNELNGRFDRLRIPDEIQSDLTKKATEIAGSISATLGVFFLTVATFVPWLILIPVIAFFFLKDANLFRLGVLRSFPAGRWRMRAEMVLQDLNTTLAAYTRAQLISCFLIGLICVLGFYMLGMKYALLLGIIAGIFEFVPLLGPALVGVIVVATAVASENPWRGLYVAVFLIVLRVIQDYLMYPRIVRGGIHLHPLAIILAILAGEQIAGIPGVFVSIPFVAVATVAYRHILDHRGHRSLIASWIEGSEQTKQSNADA
ncbi:MAG: AI-2E family transporter [Chloracidobacterium sp.]|nr:AI-2E family transporter [Chloracidobacterium sp.]MCC6825337.1 AI-2E family transporter [Acidobacteriota bacterium]MCO5333147.1 AI-2E family transporter [Pyrinomonadaceae bacterium]